MGFYGSRLVFTGYPWITLPPISRPASNPCPSTSCPWCRSCRSTRCPLDLAGGPWARAGADLAGSCRLRAPPTSRVRAARPGAGSTSRGSCRADLVSLAGARAPWCPWCPSRGRSTSVPARPRGLVCGAGHAGARADGAARAARASGAAAAACAGADLVRGSERPYG